MYARLHQGSDEDGPNRFPRRGARRQESHPAPGFLDLLHRLLLRGGTLGVAYSNNLGQIAQSLGRQSQTFVLVNVYSSCSFFGRLISAAPDLLSRKVKSARTGWLAAALVPMPLAFFLLAMKSENMCVLLAGTSLVGLSSGFVFAGAVSVTSELFGPASFGVNHNILITNIPLGSLLYGLLAAMVYDAGGRGRTGNLLDGMVVCMGRRCYSKTFLAWGGISIIGLACGFMLYLRTRAAYDPHPQRRTAADAKPQ
ncbi:hypothetical protein KSP39_PZI008252 [Platanthera zijinensis]|uniref:NFD4 C-terminal domain-containing protein n=1 Tax=Platanthera zijinensis TaxID=2320716 RepID=A0AAP0BN98_9ASPA